MNALVFELRLLEPLLIGDPLSGDPNSATTLDFIPGSVLRGALIEQYLKQPEYTVNDTQFRSLFFGNTLFLHAYPVRDKTRFLPTPLSWHREKDALETEPILELAFGLPEQQTKTLSQPFCRRISFAQAEFYTPKHQVNIHIYHAQREKVEKHESEVYRYEALAAGECFSTAILSEDMDALRRIKALLHDVTLHVGKARSAGYGAMEVENVHLEPDWNEYPADDDTNNLVVTLLSDALVRNANGAYTADAEAIFGQQAESAFVKMRVVGGFNRQWRLPLPQAMAIQAGSVFVFPYSDEMAQRLETLARHGIGERCIEGFGRIAVNWQSMNQLQEYQRPTPEKPLPKTLDPSSPYIGLAKQMAERMWRVQLDAQLRTAINKARFTSSIPQGAQLSRMRVIAREAWRANHAGFIAEQLKAMKKTASDQFAQARINEQKLSIWLEVLSSHPEEIWRELGVTDIGKRPAIGGIQAENTAELQLEYVARLIDGVLRKAAKEK